MNTKTFDNTNRGAIWPNDKRDNNPNAPQFTGTLDVEPKKFFVSAWKRKEGEGANTPVLRISVKPKDVQQADKAKPKAKAGEFDDEIR